MNVRRALRFILFPLTCLLIFVYLTGCQSTAEIAPMEVMPVVSDLPSGELRMEEQETRRIVVGFSQLGTESYWRIANSRSIQEAAKEYGIELIYRNAEQSQEKQFEAIRQFMKEKVDVIVFSPVVEYGWEPILKEVKQAGIPVIIVDRSVDVTDHSLFVTLMGSDFYDEGRKAGKYLLDKLMEQVGPIGIAELKGTVGSTPSIERKRGFEDTIAERPDLKIVKSEYANFTVEDGKRVMAEMLREMGRDISVLYAHNDDMALGAIEAIEEYGLKPGKDIIIISVDGTRAIFELMVEGKVNCVVECNPLLGPQLMMAVKELMEGRSLPKRIVTKESVYTEGMAEKEIADRKY